ncbi:MAG: site-specific integrase [Planctomycetales bacterium]|nr:site-specific integrase [Planctomycetales bacterium]
MTNIAPYTPLREFFDQKSRKQREAIRALERHLGRVPCVRHLTPRVLAEYADQISSLKRPASSWNGVRNLWAELQYRSSDWPDSSLLMHYRKFRKSHEISTRTLQYYDNAVYDFTLFYRLIECHNEASMRQTTPEIRRWIRAARQDLEGTDAPRDARHITQGHIATFLAWLQHHPAGVRTKDTLSRYSEMVRRVVDDLYPGQFQEVGRAKVLQGTNTLSQFFDLVYVQERTMKSETARQYRMSLARFAEFLGYDPKLDDIDHADVNRWIENSLQSRSPKTVSRWKKDVLAVWSYAADVVEATKNIPNPKRIRQIRIPKRIVSAWTLEELEAIIAAAAKDREFLSTGVRRGDLLAAILYVGYYSALRPQDVANLTRQQLAPRGTPIGQLKKHGDEVLCCVPQWVIEFIDQRYPSEQDRVFAWPNSMDHFYHHLWHPTLRAAGLPTGRFEGLQKLRRTAVTHGEKIAAGFGRQLAGHDPSSPVTYRNYVDPRQLVDGDGRELPDLRFSELV